ncbi:DUF1993 domain-containing protein [Cyanobium gracile UHCC 0139]|uniref:DUF1993 domain-containing protein n=1 Tax=Cyanobium gracile UHCC 0139 TaxID=3110308 RepID=A0ABU5RPQ4_9CYAN|nr:DUF1993 domain-containing protein [Cyanobium gracile]MEA5389755.1 DUF1993 domain-containing protein [Cyanobium gracile UHCC 0139]
MPEGPVGNAEITELRRIFATRLDTLDGILTRAEAHLPDINAALGERLTPDMLPLGAQIAFACNQPRGFAHWCAARDDGNLDPDVPTLAVARSHIADTRALLQSVDCDDSRLDAIKLTHLGPGLFTETTARLFVSDFWIPNFYFHITTTYAIFRTLGVPLGKADFMSFLMPHVQRKP